MSKRVLVVDDEESILEVIKIVLEGEAYEVETCMNSSFLSTMSSSLPDIILLDILLSGEDGREICMQIKTDPNLKHIPVVMLSAHAEASKVADVGGADAFLEKPFDVDALIEIVQGFVKTTPTTQE